MMNHLTSFSINQTSSKSPTLVLALSKAACWLIPLESYSSCLHPAQINQFTIIFICWHCAALFTSAEDQCRTSGPHTLQWLSLASDHSSDDNQPCMLRRVLRPMLYFFVETTEKSFKAKQSRYFQSFMEW